MGTQLLSAAGTPRATPRTTRRLRTAGAPRAASSRGSGGACGASAAAASFRHEKKPGRAKAAPPERPRLAEHLDLPLVDGLAVPEQLLRSVNLERAVITLIQLRAHGRLVQIIFSAGTRPRSTLLARLAPERRRRRQKRRLH